MDSEILDQLTNLGRDVDSEFPKPKRGRNNRGLKKADPKVDEVENNDVRDKRERLAACVLSGNSKMYLGKEYTEQQINEMDCNSVNTLLNRYESILTLFQPGVESTPPPGFSLAIATKINRSTPNFLTFNFYYRDII